MIKKYIEKYHLNKSNGLKNIHKIPPHIIEKINKKTVNCNSTDIKEKIYWIFQNITDYPTCNVCGEKINSPTFISFKTGYKGSLMYCSSKCVGKGSKHKISKTKLQQKPDTSITEDNIKEYIQNNCFDSKNRLSFSKIRKLPLEIVDKLTPKYQGNNLNEQIYWILNGLEDYPKCPTCDKRLIGKYNKNNYNTYCSISCSRKIRKKPVINLDNFTKEEIIKYIQEECYGEKRVKISKIKEIEHILNKYIPVNTSLLEKVYLLLNNFSEPPLCKCGKKVSFISTTQGYKQFCGDTCKYRINHIKNSVKDTVFHRYGVNYVSQIPEIQQKIKDTVFHRYGVDHPSQSPEIQQKIKDNCYQKYNSPCYVQSTEFKQEMIQKNLKEFGTPTHKNFTINKYNKDIQKKHREKANITNKINRYNEFKQQLLVKKNITLITEKEQFIRRNEYEFYCNLCSKTFTSSGTNYQDVCCGCLQQHSSYEYQIIDFLQNIGVNDIEHSNRTVIQPKELDIFLPEYNLAIEFNGLYWHNEEKKGKTYHRDKWVDCREKNVDLIQIFEHNWINQREIVESIIKNRLGFVSNKIYGRKCVVKEISNEEYKHFCEENHLKGSVNASVKIGLKYNNTLVSVMSFGKSRFKKDETELLRFCVLKDTVIVGGFRKLLSYYIKNYHPKRIITYCDLSYFNGNGYKVNGFKELSITEPTYFYYNGMKNIIGSRIQFQKHKLSKLLDNFDNNKTEWENMKDNGYNRVYGVGNMKLELIPQEFYTNGSFSWEKISKIG